MPRAGDPVLGYRFVLELGLIETAGFSECTGLVVETKTFEYKEGGRNRGPLKFPDVGAVGNIVLKRGFATGADTDALFRWQRAITTGDFASGDNRTRRKPLTEKEIDQRCAIVLRDEKGKFLRRWRLLRAFPVKWSGPDLKAMAGEVAIETLELACEGIELTRETS